MDRTPVINSLRSGAWLTPERLRTYPALLSIALAIAFAALVATGHGSLDRMNRPIGVDFSGIWVAGHEVRAGHPALPYDNAAHAAAQAKVFGTSDSYLPWPYPPYFLAVASLLAGLPYLAALALWQGGTLLLYLAAILRAVKGAKLSRRDVLIAALAFPAVAINIMHGQNGFLSAGLLALGGFALPQRPILAGIMLGLLAYKPQFAIAVPLAILAGGYWRAAAAAAVTVVLATLATWTAFGLAPWQGFFGSLAFTRHVILEGGGLESFKLMSAFGAVRLIGGSVSLAYGVQAATCIFVLAGLVLLWRGRADHRLKVAALILASLLSTPYAIDYDMAMLGPALAALVAHGMKRGFAPYEQTLLAFAWTMPLFARVTAMSINVPVGWLVMLAVFAGIFGRAGWVLRQPRRAAPRLSPR